jgi:hypothetical protein
MRRPVVLAFACAALSVGLAFAASCLPEDPGPSKETEAGSNDAGPDADAGLDADAGPAAKLILCGMRDGGPLNCTAGLQRCCQQPGVTGGTCVDAGVLACPGTGGVADLECDSPDDCTSPAICCAQTDGGAATDAGKTRCLPMASCVGPGNGRVCRSNPECTPGTCNTPPGKFPAGMGHCL